MLYIGSERKIQKFKQYGQLCGTRWAVSSSPPGTAKTPETEQPPPGCRECGPRQTERRSRPVLLSLSNTASGSAAASESSNSTDSCVEYVSCLCTRLLSNSWIVNGIVDFYLFANTRWRAKKQQSNKQFRKRNNFSKQKNSKNDFNKMKNYDKIFNMKSKININFPKIIHIGK